MAFIGVSGIMVFVTTFVVHYALTYSDFLVTSKTRDMNMFPDDWFKAIASIPNLLLALSFHMNFFPVYKGMRNANDRKMSLATLTGIFVCSIFYLLLGILGYHLVYTMHDS
jgi:amino acid permease